MMPPMSMKSILVCLEGSPESERATEMAIEVARRLQGELVGLAIVDEPDIRAGEPTSIGGASFKKERDTALLHDAEAHVGQWLNAFTERCRQAGVTARTLDRRGRPAAEILSEMETHDLTLMGRKTNFRVETQASDPGTRSKILHRAQKPLILVAEDHRGLDESHVLAAYDGSSAAKRALRSLGASGLAAGRAVHVASVDDEGARAWELADRGAELLRSQGIRTETHSVVSTLPIADALLQLRGRLGAGLIVMGAYAHSRLSELIWGSVTRAIVEKSPVPLYLHH
jgi:nucleotide-binding universal stress UspA family protein